ncbi:hypothetical protein BG015_006279 [Linnemannia schmuckeri]|uniref:Sld7 C-terminal domain-containing protein n=1 Tax=Linnemannia schmuckeri TaxID=64567 RepID=A0A9P5VC52_9FUNG|nr:hypothetical protein BG015_006279 [Linnemannia schmuckeri]
MDTQDDDIISQENTPPFPVLNENKDYNATPSKETNFFSPAYQQPSATKEIVPIDEENAFSFRKKRPSSKLVRSSPRRSSQLTSPQATGRNRANNNNSSSSPILTSPSMRPARGKSAVQEELSLESVRSVTFAAGTLSNGLSPFSTPNKGGSSRSTSSSPSQKDPSSLQRWDTIWKCSWIVPALVPVSSNAATNTTATTAARKSTTGFPQRKSATLSTQQTVFDGKDGIKVQGTVTELPGIVFALPSSVSNVTTSLDELSLQDHATIRKENVEMHLVARIRICTFPIFLLAPGCVEPCRIFTSPDSQAASQFLIEMLNDEDIAYMKEQSTAGIETAMGSIGLLLRVAPKQGQVGKKKSALASSLKQEINPFMMPVALGSSGDDPKIDPELTGEKTGSQRKLFQETSMFLVYGALVKEKQPAGRHAEPIISFFAYPLVDQASLMDHMLLNARSLDRMKQETEKADLGLERVAEDFVSYDDPMVNSIMNGCDSEQESGYSSDQVTRKDIDLDEDDSLHQEMELLRAIERNKSWAPYVVTSTTLPPPLPGPISTTTESTNTSAAASKEARNEHSLSRAQTMDNVGLSRKDGSSRSTLATAFSRHRSMDGHTSGSGGGLASALVDATSGSSASTRPVRKGISRIKSPSRASQRPLDVTTEGLRRMKSPSRRAAASGSRGSSSPAIADDIPDLMTMMKMKKRQNIERAALAAATAGVGDGGNGDDPFSASSPLRSRVAKGVSGRGSSRSGGSDSAGRSNPFLVTLKNIQSEEQQDVIPTQKQEHQRQVQDDDEMLEAKPTRLAATAAAPAASSQASSSYSRSQPAPLPAAPSLVGDVSTTFTSSKSIESRNQATIKGLTASVLSKNNIGTDHEEFEECADHLYRTVTFAMRKDITTKVYHLEELERLMDRHASMM